MCETKNTYCDKALDGCLYINHTVNQSWNTQHCSFKHRQENIGGSDKYICEISLNTILSQCSYIMNNYWTKYLPPILEFLATPIIFDVHL